MVVQKTLLDSCDGGTLGRLMKYNVLCGRKNVGNVLALFYLYYPATLELYIHIV